MAGLAVRDRFYTRRVAHAMMSPTAILATGAGLAAGIVVGLPVAGAAALGVLGWSAPVAAALFRGGPGSGRGERIDPFTLQEPWRTRVQNVVASRARVLERAGSTRSGPLRDRLQEIADRVDTAVDEAWQIAKRGQSLADARRAIDTERIDRQITDLERSLADSPGEARLTEALEARQAQRAAAERMARVITDTDTQLRLMDARLGEVVVRAAELSVHVGSDSGLTSLSSDVDSLITEMEALRLALDETHGAPGGLPTGDR